MKISNDILNWLLEKDNPGVRLRTLREICGYSEKHKDIKETRRLVVDSLEAARDLSWKALKFNSQKVVYSLTALAESGLSRKDVDIDSVAAKILNDEKFECSCGNFMALRAVAMLGYERDRLIKQRSDRMIENQLPDGGWLCLHRVRKMNKIPKSCIRAAMHSLLFVGELKKKGIACRCTDQLIGYFLKRRLLFRTDMPQEPVVPGITDAFFPNEYFSVGLPVLLESLTTLGAGNAKELDYAWSLLDEKKDSSGRIVLEGTLPKKTAYLPRERVGKPGKWATLYAYLALNKKL